MDNKQNKITFLAGVKYKEKIYFSAANTNGLFSFDLETKKVEFISAFVRERVAKNLHVKAFLHENYMWLMPFSASYVACVDLSSMEISYYDVQIDEGCEGAYYDGVRAGNALYLIPYYAKNVIKIDTINRTCTVIFSADYLANCWASGGFVNDNMLCIVNRDGRVGLKINIDNNEVLYENAALNGNQTDYSARIGEYYWLMSFLSGEIRRCRITETCDLVDEVRLEQSLPCYRGTELGGGALLFSCGDSRKFVFIDKDGHGEVIENWFDGVEESGQWFNVSVVDSIDGKWISGINGIIFDISNMDSVERYCLSIGEEELEKYFQSAENKQIINNYLSSSILSENDAFVSLRRYLKLLSD